MARRPPSLATPRRVAVLQRQRAGRPPQPARGKARLSQRSDPHPAEDARHEHEDTIEDCREKAVSGHRQEVCRIRWKEGVQRRSEETLGFPTEVIRRREEHAGAAASRRRTTRNR